MNSFRVSEGPQVPTDPVGSGFAPSAKTRNEIMNSCTKHLQAYLDEFAFRFNRRKSRHVGMIFFRLAQHGVQTGPFRTAPWSGP